MELYWFYLYICAALTLVGLVVHIRPKIQQFENLLVISSGLRARMLCLGAGGRRIVVDPHEQTVKITLRSFWVASSTRVIEFDQVGQILFGANLLMFGRLRQPDEGTFFDIYSVQLCLKDGESVLIYRFLGDMMNEGEPLMLADMLSATIGVPIDYPVEV